MVCYVVMFPYHFKLLLLCLYFYLNLSCTRTVCSTWILKKCIESQGQQEQMIKDQQIQMKQSKELFESNKTKFTNECTEQIKEHLQKIKRNHESEINRLKQELQSKHDDEMHRLKEDLQSTQHEDPITTFFSNSELKDILKIWEDTKTNTKKRTVQEKQQTNHDTKNKDPTRKKQKVPNPMLTGVIQRTVLVGEDEDEDEGILVF